MSHTVRRQGLDDVVDRVAPSEAAEHRNVDAAVLDLGVDARLFRHERSLPQLSLADSPSSLVETRLEEPATNCASKLSTWASAIDRSMPRLGHV